MTDHKPLPVAGYNAQSDENVHLVNLNKCDEEHILQLLDIYAASPDVDKRWLAVAAARIAELEREASRAEIYRAVLESAGYQNIDTIKDVMNAKALGAVVACSFIGLQNNLASATSRAERLEAALVKLGPTDGWAAMIAELQGWTASEFLSGEGGNTKDQVECYSFMCRLIGWLMVAQDAAALSPAPSEGSDDE